ncbi:poly-beta-1,6-N-acetyl-D-glucosamine biosynthesis protein PgaD, partial [Escherichia coli]|nr:poly-beta-1,6-N-acetyl-D-glucosamine biosynthesis protein PgaD [Escherichia coli]
MSQPLIFTERRLLPRIIDVLLTIFAWVGFLYLIYKGLITALAHSPYMGVRPFFTT